MTDLLLFLKKNWCYFICKNLPRHEKMKS